MRWLVVVVLACGLLAGCGRQNAVIPSNWNDGAVDAATNFVKNKAPDGKFAIRLDKVDDEFARARVVPSDGSTQPEYVFLKRQDHAWTVLTSGTTFDANAYQQFGIPGSVQLPK